jgi:type II secretory pathway pseudopilin PulG
MIFSTKSAAGYRTGFTVLEVSLALSILLAAAILLTQFLVASSRQQKLADQRRLALEELSTRLERMQAARWDEVDAATMEAQEFRPDVKARLPGVKLKANISDEPGPAGGKRVHLTINWEERGGPISLELTGWKYPPPRARP